MKITNEAKIGILVVITLGILGVLHFKTANYSFSIKNYELKVRFKNIEGVEVNSPVTLNGLDVGRVKDIQILYGETTRVELTLLLQENAKLHEGAKAFVKNMGFMGEKYVALTSGDDGKPFLKQGAVFDGQEPTDLDSVLAEGKDIVTNVKEISERINERLKVNAEAIDEVVKNMNTTMKHVASISGNINERLEINKLLVDGIVLNVHSATQNLEELSLDLKENPWKLLYRPKKKNKK